MKNGKEIKEKFSRSNQELVATFGEIYENYESIESDYNSLKKDYNLLKNEYDSLKKDTITNKDLENTFGDSNCKFGIVNLTKLNDEVLFDAINYFNKSCPYCKKDLYAGNIRAKIEIDHFFPIAKGGQDFPWNLLPTCKECNRKKRDKLPFEFLDASTYIECYKYLENVMLKITQNHEDKLQRDEIIKHSLVDYSLKKKNHDQLITELMILFNLQKEELITSTNKSKTEEIKNKILTDSNLRLQIEKLSSYVISIGIIYKALTGKQEPSYEMKKQIKLACVEIFGEPIQKGSTWKKWTVLEAFINYNKTENIIVSEDESKF